MQKVDRVFGQILSKINEVSNLMDLCPVQDSFRFRARFLAQQIANLLIDERGKLVTGALAELDRLFDLPLFSTAPNREGDALILSHLRSCILQLEELWPFIHKFSLPLCHKRGEEFIRETLFPEEIGSVGDGHIRRAVLTAWFTLLRQATGSCFATAPAILIQQSYPKQFFKDLYELLTTGRLRKVVDGREYIVPLSLSAGSTDLQKSLAPFHANLAASPGLKAAFAAALLEQPDELSSAETVEKLLRERLLIDLDITEEEISEEEKLSGLQMTPLLAKHSAVIYYKPTPRAQKTSDLKKRLRKGCRAFQAFAECALLRAWEYTIASFCDVKVDFARWNLNVGLGLHPDQKGGVGSFIYEFIHELHGKEEKEVERAHAAYLEAVNAERFIESAIRAAGSDTQRSQLKAELNSHAQAAHLALEMRDQAIQRAEALASLFPALIEKIHEKLQEHFQELYDPSLLVEEMHQLEDSPAGFRLVYKHGRADPTQWTSIDTGELYLESLREFFTAIEPELSFSLSADPSLITSIITALIQFIQKADFLESAINRSKKEGRRSPWDYTSGGNLQTLLQSYYARNRPFTETKLIPHSPQDLIETFYEIRKKQTQPLLMHSPTHAFLFYPQLLSSDPEKTFRRCQEMRKKWLFDQEIEEYLLDRFSSRLPPSESALLLHRYRQKESPESLVEFRRRLIELLPVKKGVELVDSLLYEELPVLPAKEAITTLLFSFGSKVEFEWNRKYIGSRELQQVVKSLIAKDPLSSIDLDLRIAESARNLGLCYPDPILFGDTNWSEWFFGFVIHPITGSFDLWRLNRTGTRGFPMWDWKEWLSPENSSEWIILHRPEEYIPP